MSDRIVIASADVRGKAIVPWTGEIAKQLEEDTFKFS